MCVTCKDQEKLCSAAEVILSSAIGIVSCSSNMDFRNACLNSMKVGKKIYLKMFIVNSHSQAETPLTKMFICDIQGLTRWLKSDVHFYCICVFVRCVTPMSCQPPSVNHWGEWHHGNSFPREGATPLRWMGCYYSNASVLLDIRFVTRNVTAHHYFHRWKNILRVTSPPEQKSEDVCVWSTLSLVVWAVEAVNTGRSISQ